MRQVWVLVQGWELGEPGRPDQGLPGYPPGVGSPVFPSNPIAPGGPPPGVNVPGFPTQPIAPGGGYPSQPIGPGGGSPSHPIGPGGGSPSHPIAPGGGGQEPDGEWAWSPVYGWVYVPGQIAAPPKPGGGSGARPDQGLPSPQPRPDQDLPHPPPQGSGRPSQPINPTPQPKRG